MSLFSKKPKSIADFEKEIEKLRHKKKLSARRNKNLLAYLDFDDGRKIMTSAWSEKNYLGLADIPLNTCVSVSFQFSAKGISYLRSVEVI